MNKQKIVLGLTALALGTGVIFTTASSVLAYRGDPAVTGPNYTAERHEAMEKAFETKDYKVSNYVKAIEKHLKAFPFQVIIANNNLSQVIPNKYDYEYVYLPANKINEADLGDPEGDNIPSEDEYLDKLPKLLSNTYKKKFKKTINNIESLIEKKIGSDYIKQSGREATDVAIRSETEWHFYQTMKLFYRKHYADSYSSLISSVIFAILDLKLASIKK